MGQKLIKCLSPILAGTVLAAALLPCLTPKATALQYEGSDPYEAGKYYRALQDVQLTGDSRTDIVNVALSQVGYQEGGNRFLLSGEVYGGLNFTEYCTWYGIKADMWCAIFVSWCANVSGVSTDVIPKHAYTPIGLKFFRDRGQSWTQAQIAAGEYTPKAGDLIYFRSSRNENDTNHVGLVTGCSDGMIYTVEGNISAFSQVTNGGMVATHSYPLDNPYIVAVCVPDYEQSGTSVSRYDALTALRQAVVKAENAAYDQISDAYGSISLGIGQWYGPKAQALLQAIREEDPDCFAALDTAGIGMDLDGADWSRYQPDAGKLASIRAILASDPGQRIQNYLLECSLADLLTMAEERGITELKAQALCALVRHMGGAAAVDRLLSQAKDLSYASLLSTLPQHLRPAADLL